MKRAPTLRTLAPSLALLLLAGCARPEGDALTIATPWPPAERAALAAEFRAAHPSAPPIAWLPLAPGDDPARIVPGVDLILGVPAPSLDAIAAELAPIAEAEARPWRVARRQSLGLDTARGVTAGPALDDPRRDALTLAWAKARLDVAGWPKGYGDLVRTAAQARRVGRAGSGPGRVRRGDASAAPDAGIAGPLDERTTFARLDGAPPWLEGVALVRGAAHEAEARAFLAFLAERGQSEPVPEGFPPADPVADGLLADLLGAALVDAQDELWAAAGALDRAGRPDRYGGFLDDPPPWPPTSVAKLRDRPEADDLLDALAREIAPDPEARAWLLRTWDAPAHPIDAAWLRDAAGAADGRLAREPRFRSWLRAEWTAWARQHYRRIAREAVRASSDPAPAPGTAS